MMKRLAFILVSLLSLPTLARGELTYDLVNYPDDQGGYTIWGTITTDGRLGTLTSTDIIAWSATITGTGTIGSANGSGFISLQGLVASPTSLELPFGPPNGPEVTMIGHTGVFDRTGFYDLTAICWINYYIQEQEPEYFGWFQNGHGGRWDTLNPIMNGTDIWVIATREDVVTPEPSNLVVSGVAIGLLLLARVRFR